MPSVAGRRASGKVLPANRRRIGLRPSGRSSSSGDLVRLYLDEIGREPLLSEAEERELAQAIERGREAGETLRLDAGTLAPAARAALEHTVDEGERARERFVRANLRLVVAIARRWSRSPLPLLDLIQEGNVGLMRAVERFDHRRGFRFSTFATWLIRQSISRAVADTGRLVRLPVRTGEALARVVHEQHRVEERAGGRPSVEAIAAGTGLTREHVAGLLRVAPEPVSLSEPVTDDGSELGDLVADPAPHPDEVVVAALTAAEVGRLLPLLDDDEREVLVLRFGLHGAPPMTLAAVSRALGVSPDVARHRQTRALRTLRRGIDARAISRYSHVACS